MANKPVSPTKRARPIGVSLPKEIAARGKRLAFERDISFSAFVRALIVRELEAAK
jgi:hypothetical protein